MSLVVAFNFFVIAAIMLGLFFIARANYGQLGQSSRYWSIAIVCDSVGLAMMGAFLLIYPDMNQTSKMGTVANTLLFASSIYQAVSIRALNKEIAKTTKFYVVLGIILFAIIWEISRLHTDVNSRLIVFASYAILVFIWQLLELRTHKESSSQIRILRVSVAGEIFFTALRLVAVAAVSIKITKVDELPALGLFSVWTQYGLKVVAYAALLAYWTEALGREKAKIELEKQQFRELSERQEKVISDLARLNKAAAAGVMAASIAHELSQPLQSLVLNSELLRQELSSGQPNHPLLLSTVNEQIVSVEKMVDVIKTMRGMFTEQAGNDRSVDLFQLIERLSIFINAHARKHGVEIDYVQSDGATLISVRPAEIQQVILNLVANAFDALKLVGEEHDKKIRIHVNAQMDWISCKVEDSGHGIPEQQLDGVFKFLKSSKSTGMGLGLWLSKYIVERNHGEIFVAKSELGGAKFTIQFPAIKADVQTSQS